MDELRPELGDLDENGLERLPDFPSVVETAGQDDPVCGACGVLVNSEVERTTRRLLASLDLERHQLLRETYQGEAPEVLCAECMNLAVGALNGGEG